MVLKAKPKPSSNTSTSDRKGKNDHPSNSGSQKSSNAVVALRSRIREMGPICKSRKKSKKGSPTKREERDDDLDRVFENIEGQHESLWLSSESLSPLYTGGDFRFMSPRDYSIDERLVSFLSSLVDFRLFPDKRLSFFDGAKANPIKEASLLLEEDCLGEEVGSWLIDPAESVADSSSFLNESSNSSFIYSDFDACSSDLLSESLDLEDMDFDEPLMWPFNGDFEWSSRWEYFCESPRRGLGRSATLSNTEGRKGHSKRWWKRRIVIGSGLNASKIVEFKRGRHRIVRMMTLASKHGIIGSVGKKHKLGKGNIVFSPKRLRKMSMVDIDELKSQSHSQYSHSVSSSMDFDSSDLWVSLINLNGEDSELTSDCEEGLESDFPSPSYTNTTTSHELCSTEIGFCEPTNWDQMDLDEPLFWPYDKGQNWTLAWDGFCTSPRKGSLGKRGGRVPSIPISIRVRIHDQRAHLKRSLLVGAPGLKASKIVGFKRKRGGGRKAKAMRKGFGKSYTSNGAQKMDDSMENEGGVAIENMLGLGEFDGHEGVDVEFVTDCFSVLEE